MHGIHKKLQFREVEISAFDIIAEAYGIKAENVTDISGAEKAIKDMLGSDKPYLLQVFVDREERTII